MKIGFNYTYNESSLKTNSNRNLQYLLRDTTFYVEEDNNTDQTNEDHLINAKINIKLDSSTSLEILPSYSLSKTINNNNFQNSFITESLDTN